MLGGVLLWDVPLASHRLLRRGQSVGREDHGKSTTPESVVDMAWVHCGGPMLAVLLAPCTVLLIDPSDGTELWKRDWHGMLLKCMARDPLDKTHIGVCGDQVS